jgi:hypothetical protein
MNTSDDTFQTLVSKIKNDNIQKELFVTQNDITGEGPYIPANIVHKMQGHFCEGLHHKIHMVVVVADMELFNVKVIAINKEGDVVAQMQTIDTGKPRVAIEKHTDMVKHIRHGGSEFTDILNLECRLYYSEMATKKNTYESVDESVDEKEVCVDEKEVYEIPLPVPHKAPRIQPFRSTRKIKSYTKPGCKENDMKQTVESNLLSETLKSCNKKRKVRMSRYTCGSYTKKRKGV